MKRQTPLISGSASSIFIPFLKLFTSKPSLVRLYSISSAMTASSSTRIIKDFLIIPNLPSCRGYRKEPTLQHSVRDRKYARNTCIPEEFRSGAQYCQDPDAFSL